MQEIMEVARKLEELMRKQSFKTYADLTDERKTQVDALYCSLRKFVGNPL